MNEITNLNDFKKSLENEPYIYADLYSSDGKKLIPRNRLKKDFDSHITKIFTKIKSPNVQNGTLFIRCSVSPTSSPDIFTFHKGGVKTLSENQTQPTTIIVNEKVKERSPDVLTYDKALEYQNTIAKLEYEKQALEDKVKALQEELDSLEYVEEEEKSLAEPNAATSWKDVIENISTTLLPILDRHYTIKEQSLKLELAKLQGKKQPRYVPPKQPQITPEQEEALENGVSEWLEKVQNEDEELYNVFEQMSEQVNSMEEFLAFIKTNYPDSFKDLENYLQVA